MTNIPIDIVIPIYNEGENVIKLLNHFQEIIKTRFRVLLCYDLDADNVFNNGSIYGLGWNCIVSNASVLTNS